jgi:hypothetical protein
VERWFGLLTDKLIHRGVHTSVKALEDDITAWTDTWNEKPRPFTWPRPHEILADYLAKAGTTGQEAEQIQPSGFLAQHTRSPAAPRPSSSRTPRP